MFGALRMPVEIPISPIIKKHVLVVIFVRHRCLPGIPATSTSVHTAQPFFRGDDSGTWDAANIVRVDESMGVVEIVFEIHAHDFVSFLRFAVCVASLDYN